MSRVKKAKHALKRRRKILKAARGFRQAGSRKERAARERLLHAGVHAFADRRKKKGQFRRLWNIKINAAVRPWGLSYSKFMAGLKKKGVALDRKSLAELAEREPAAFKRLVENLTLAKT